MQQPYLPSGGYWREAATAPAVQHSISPNSAGIQSVSLEMSQPTTAIETDELLSSEKAADAPGGMTCNCDCVLCNSPPKRYVMLFLRVCTCGYSI